jgi:hypothetical protein
VSYTYRTDKLLDAIGNAQGFVNQRNCPKQWVGFAIELETELQEATFEIERLRKANLQLQEGAEQQKQRIKRLEEELIDVKNKHSVLIADVVFYEDGGDRIKRLEEAGNAVEKKLGCGCGCYGLCKDCQRASENWDKAKEAKP